MDSKKRVFRIFPEKSSIPLSAERNRAETGFRLGCYRKDAWLDPRGRNYSWTCITGCRIIGNSISRSGVLHSSCYTCRWSDFPGIKRHSPRSYGRVPAQMATRCRHCVRSISVHSFSGSDCFARGCNYDLGHFSLLCPVCPWGCSVDYGRSWQDVPSPVESRFRSRWSVEHHSRDNLPSFSTIASRDLDLSIVHRTLVCWHRGHSSRNSRARDNASHRLGSEQDLILDLDHESENRRDGFPHYP